MDPKVVLFTAKLKKMVIFVFNFIKYNYCYLFLYLAPSVPADIKAVLSSIKTIIVSWLPPLRPNGRLTGYILYISILSGHKDVRFFYTHF